MKIPLPPCVQCVCVCVCVCVWMLCMRGWEACVRWEKSLPTAQLPSFWRMVPFHLIYLSRKWTTHFSFFFLPPWFLSFSLSLWHHPSFTSLSLSLSLSFNSLYLIISSSPAVWLFPPVSNCAGDTTWSSSPPLGMPLIPTFPSPSV